MLTDLSFNDDERAGAKRRLVRLVVTCLVASSLASFAVARELKIRDEFQGIPQALSGDRDSLLKRRDAIVKILERHHVWAGAFGARRELDQLVLSIHRQERVEGDQARRRAAEMDRAREEAEAARVRGLMHAERHQFDLALDQFRRALELSDAVGEQAWSGGTWEHREPQGAKAREKRKNESINMSTVFVARRLQNSKNNSRRHHHRSRRRITKKKSEESE